MKINDISMQDLEITGFIIMNAMRTIFKYIIGITLILSIAYACSEELTTTDNILFKNQESLIKTRGGGTITAIHTIMIMDYTHLVIGMLGNMI